MMADFQRFARVLEARQNQPVVTFDILCELADQLIGVKLFTLTEIDNSRHEARRVYTNMPEAYPVLGTKPMKDDAWSDHVQKRHETFVANSIEAIAEVFFDHELIRNLGCESVINIPVVVSGRLLGTINCLHQAGHYSPERVALAERLKLPGAAAFLLNHSGFSQGDH